MKTSILFIINPISGDIDKTRLVGQIESELNRNFYETQIVYTKHAGHAKHLSMQAVLDKIDIVVAVGGDGSVNEIAQALVHSNTALGIIPLGSGNGLAGHLGLPIRDVLMALKVIQTGKKVVIDTGMSNQGTFVSCAGEGLDAAVARRYRHQSKRGFWSYFKAAVKETLFSFKPEEFKFETDEGESRSKALLFSVFNSRYFGYGIGIYPQSSIRDGFLHVVVVPELPIHKLLPVVILGLLGKIERSKHVRIIKTKRVKVLREEKRAIQLDGDSIMTSNDFLMEVVEASLKVIVPQELDETKL